MTKKCGIHREVRVDHLGNYFANFFKSCKVFTVVTRCDTSLAWIRGLSAQLLLRNPPGARPDEAGAGVT